MITVIEQSTTERDNETRVLFQKIQPHLDEGFTYKQSLVKVGEIKENTRLNSRNGWFYHLIKYGESQGYAYGDHIYHHANRVGKLKALSWDHLW